MGFTNPCTRTDIIKLFLRNLRKFAKIYYSLLYGRLIWGYKNANEQLINRAIESFNWEKSFEGKNIHDQIYLFIKIILSIFLNFIPNKIVACNDKNLPWFNDEIRQTLIKKDELFKQFLNNGKLQNDYDQLQCIHSDLLESIRSSKEKCHLRLCVNYLIHLPQKKLTGQYVKRSLMVEKPL